MPRRPPASLAVIAAVVVGGVNIFGGRGRSPVPRWSAFLGFIANALILVGLSQFWLQAVYGVVILVAVTPMRSCCGACSGRREGAPDDRPRARPTAGGRGRALGGPACSCSWGSSPSASASAKFLTAGNFSNLIAALIEVAIMSLPMALIIIAGEIDLSVEAMAGLPAPSWASSGRPVPLEIAIPAVLVSAPWAAGSTATGDPGGLPSLVVTLGTLALSAVSRSSSWDPGYQRFPGEFTDFGFGDVPGTPIPWPFLIFLAIAIVLGTVLHRT